MNSPFLPPSRGHGLTLRAKQRYFIRKGLDVQVLRATHRYEASISAQKVDRPRRFFSAFSSTLPAAIPLYSYHARGIVRRRQSLVLARLLSYDLRRKGRKKKLAFIATRGGRCYVVYAACHKSVDQTRDRWHCVTVKG